MQANLNSVVEIFAVQMNKDSISGSSQMWPAVGSRKMQMSDTDKRSIQNFRIDRRVTTRISIPFTYLLPFILAILFIYLCSLFDPL